MSYLGDFRLGDTLDCKFCTVTTTGAPTTLAGTPAISAYVGNGTTEITAGITLSVDFDSRTGMHNVRVVATGGNGFATATNVDLVITAGTVGGTSVVGYVVGTFSIENRSALMPTTAARTLDVTATGEAGVDWANVGSPTTSLALTGTTIAVTQKVDVDTIKTNPVVNAGTITFPTNATLASTTNITAGTVTTATNVTTVNGLANNVITAASINADAITAAKIADGAIDAATFAASAITATVIAADAITAAKIADGAIDAATFAAGAINAAAIAADAITDAKVAADVTIASVTGAVGSVTAGVSVANGGIVAASFGASAVDAAALATDAVNEIVAAVFARAFSAAYDSLTFDQIVKVMVSSLAAKLSGAATATVSIRNLADNGDVIVATVDASGNRTAVSRTP